MHIRELSSIRGLAAIVVLLDHSFNLISRSGGGQDGRLNLIDLIGAAFNGAAAVQLFFVLSGLVLSLSLDRQGEDRPQWLASFYIRRIFRIYPALWVSLALALALLPLARNACSPSICSSLLGREYQEIFGLRNVILSFAGLFTHLNSPMWSLRVELAYSALFPAIYLIIRHKRTRRFALIFFFALALLPIPYVGYNVMYALAFALGSAILHFEPRGRDDSLKVAFFISLLVLIVSAIVLSRLNFGRTIGIANILASFVIVYCIYHKVVKLDLLRSKSAFYLGEISYSVYILHFPLLYAVLYTLKSAVGADTIADAPVSYSVALSSITLILTLALSSLNFLYAEKPIQEVGRALSRRRPTNDVAIASSRLN